MDILSKIDNTDLAIAVISAKDLTCEHLVTCDGSKTVGVGTEYASDGLHVIGQGNSDFSLRSNAITLHQTTIYKNILVAFSVTGKFEKILFRIRNKNYLPMREHVIHPVDQGEKVFQLFKNVSPTCSLDFEIVGNDIDLCLSDITIIGASDALLQSRDNALVADVLGKARPKLDLDPIGCDLKLLWVEITSRCNLRCRSCSKFYGLERPWEDMDIGLFRHIAQSLFSHTQSLSLTGIGEPLHHRQADEVFSIIEKYPDLKLDFVSNGELWTEAWLDRIGTFDAQVSLSMDGPSEELHRFNRGPKANYQKIVDLLDETQARAIRDPDFRLRFRLNMVIMRNNMLAMPDMVRFAAEHGVQMLIFILMGNWGQERTWYEQQSPYAMNDIYAEKYEESKELGQKLGVDVILPPPAALPAGAGAAPFQFQDCSIPFDSLYIHFDGRVSPCCAMRPYLNGRIQDYSQEDVPGIWNSARQRFLRAEMRQHSYNPLCLHCDLNYGINKGRPADSMAREAFPSDTRGGSASERLIAQLQGTLHERNTQVQQLLRLSEAMSGEMNTMTKQMDAVIGAIQNSSNPSETLQIVEALKQIRNHIHGI